MQLKLLAKTLDDYQRQNGTEYWYARDLWGLLGYSSWRNFEPAIQRAKDSCQTVGESVEVHFAQVRKTQKSRNQYGETDIEIDDIKLTRYACYLIAQNGNPRIPEIALAQTYFAMQTRKQELLEQSIEEIERMDARRKLGETDKEFSKVMFEHGVDSRGIGEIKSVGDQVLFGGYNTKKMKQRLGVHSTKKPLADVLPTVTLKAKDLAVEMTTLNAKNKKLQGKLPIKNEHIVNNRNVRKALVSSGIVPEKLPPAEDIKLVEGRHKPSKKLMH